MRDPKRVFILLILLFVLALSMSLPENYPVRFSIGPLKVNQTIHPLVIDFTLFGIHIQKSFPTQLGLDLAGGSDITLEADMKGISSGDRQSALDASRSVVERRVNFLGVSEPVVQTAISPNHYRIIVELPGVTDTQKAVQIIGQTAQLEFRELNNNAATQSATPSSILAITKPSGLTGKDLQRSQLAYSQKDGSPEVAITFTDEGAKKFSEITKRLVGKYLLIFLDNQLVSSPTVNEQITSNNAVISGQFTVDQAKDLVLQLNAGALPVPIKIVEQRVVEATLGSASVEKSIRAGFIGLLVVAGFMIALYHRLGIISVLGLFMYGVLSFAVFRLIPITLTLPGIAGFLLSIGMAVDSNILIFERYKEEKRTGKPWRMAMEHAFGKAWDSIRDANITTIITCLILFNPMNLSFLPSSGLVRGFAITLLLGVVISLFTGIIVTRTFIRILYREK